MSIKKYPFIILILLFVFSSFDLPLAQAATLTFNNDNGLGNNNWANAVNWGTGIIAGTSDTALITANVDSISSGVASVFLANFSNGAIWDGGLTLTVEDMATFYDTSSNDGSVKGNSTFNDTSYNNGGTIEGNATFDTTWYSGTIAPTGGVFTINGSNYWSGNVTGTVYGSDYQPITSYVFNGSSYNLGTINGNATFDTTWYSGTIAPSGGVFTINGSNYWSGNVTGTVYGSDNQAIASYIFNNSSYNQGTIKGDATFNDTSYNSSGTINGNAKFDTTWYSGTTAPSGGVFTINGSNYWSGNVTGTVYGSDNLAITSYIFNNSSYNQGSINGNATFNDTSYNNGGTIEGNAIFDTTWYSGTTAPTGGVLTINGSNYWSGNVTGTVYGSDNQAITSYIFNNSSKNQGAINGNVTFNDTSYNSSSTINGNAIFNDASYNSLGTVNKNATFNDTSYSKGGVIYGNATFNTTWYSGTTAPTGGVFTINGSNYWANDVKGTVYGSDNQVITSYIFNNMAYDKGTINGNATFNDTSYDSSSTINGNATFNGTSYNGGGIINGNATFDTTEYSGTTAPSGGVFTINGSNFWSGNVTGTVYGSDNQAITSYIFNNSSYNQGGIDGNATFNDTSYNSSNTINGNVAFNDTSYNNGGIINGNATFNDSSYNNFGSTINGNAAFNGTSYNDFGATINGSVVFNSTADQSGTINAGIGTVSGNFSTTYGIIIGSGTVSSDISGVGDLTKTSNSTVILSGSNTYTGLTTISGGTLQIGNNGATGSIGTGGDVIDDANLAFDLTNSSTVSNSISGPGTVTQNGTGTVTLSGANTYTGATIVNTGTLEAGAVTQAFGLASAVAVAVGGTLDLGGFNETIGSLAGAGTVTNNGEADAIVTAGGSNASTVFSGDIQDGTTNKVGISKEGSGILVLSGDNTYTGATTLGAGTLNLGSNNAIGSGALIFSGGTLQYSSSNSTDYSGQFSASPGQEYNIDTNGQNVTFANQLNSTGGILTKTGNGILTLTNTNNYSGGTTINAGTLQVENASALGTGPVTNNSALTLGTISLSLGGVYTQNAGSALNLTLSAVNNGSITSPSALVAAGSTVNVTVVGLIPNNEIFEIVNTGGTGTGGAPSTVTSNTFVTFTSSILNGNLILTAENSLDAYADNPNARAVARDLDNIISNPSSDMTNVLKKLQSLSNSQITAALNEMGPIVDGGVVENSSVMLNNFIGATIDRVKNVLSRENVINDSLDKAESALSPHQSENTGVSSGDDPQMNGIWAKPYGSYLSQARRQSILGYDAWNTGTVVGLDHLIGDSLTIGIGGGYAYGQVDSSANNASTDITSAQGIIYAGYQDPDSSFFIDGAGTVAWNWYNGERSIDFINRTAGSTYDGQEYSAYLGSGYKFDVGKSPEYGPIFGENFEFTPLVSLQWTHQSVGSYTETNAGSLDLNVNKQNYDTLESSLGGSISSPEKYDWGIFTPEIHMKWLYDYIEDKMVMTSSFVDDGGSFVANGAAPARGGMNIGGKVSFDFKNNMSLIAAFDSELKSGFFDLYGSGTVRYKF